MAVTTFRNIREFRNSSDFCSGNLAPYGSKRGSEVEIVRLVQVAHTWNRVFRTRPLDFGRGYACALHNWAEFYEVDFEDLLAVIEEIGGWVPAGSREYHLNPGDE